MPKTWVYKKDNETIKIQPTGTVTSDQGSFLLNHTLTGGGILHAPNYLVSKAIKENKLITLLNQYNAQGPDWWIVYPYSRHPSLKLRSFIAFLMNLLD